MTADPSTPLVNRSHETFAQEVARAGAGHAAGIYRQTVARGAITPESARAAAYALRRRPVVAARIAHLRREARAPHSVPMTEGGARGLLNEVTAAVDALHREAQERGAEPAALARLRRVISAHAGRVSALGLLSDEANPSHDDLPSASTIAWPDPPSLALCACSPEPLQEGR